ncbi:MAG: hypothetical protein ACQESN_08160 [Thermotogota bacterium]
MVHLERMFELKDNNLKKDISKSDQPFLGLFEKFFETKLKKTLVLYIKKDNDPIARFIWFLEKFPALSASLLTIELKDNYGESEHYEVYPIIEKNIFGTKIKTQTQKEKLWHHFRRACIKLGLNVSSRTSGVHYITKEFLYQVGLPDNYIKDFCNKAIEFSSKYGLPEINDTEDMKFWQKDFENTLKPPFSKIAREAIERDDNSYYLRTFFKAYNSDLNENNNLSFFGKVVLSQIKNQTVKKNLKKSKIPYIVFKDYEYGIILPAGEDEIWEINCNDYNNKFKGYAEDYFLPFEPGSLNKEIIIKNKDKRQWKFSLWPEGRKNEFLIFSRSSGRFVKSSSLGDGLIELDAGNYILMLRFKPTNCNEIDCFSEEPSIYLKNINIPPGESFYIEKGPAKICLQGEKKPSVIIDGESYSGVNGRKFFSSHRLIAEVNIPEEFRSHGSEYTLCLESDILGDQIYIDLNIDEQDDKKKEISSLLKRWKGGLSRLSVELKRKGDLKTLARTSCFIWNGLREIKNSVFIYEKYPFNLDDDLSENFYKNEDKEYLSFKDENLRFFKLIFKLNQDQSGKELFVLTWSVPGIFLSITDYKDKDRLEKNISLGSCVSIDSKSSKILNIYGEGRGGLSLGHKYIRGLDFEKRNCEKIPVLSLFDHIDPDNNILNIHFEGMQEKEALIEIVTPFTAEYFKCQSDEYGEKIEFELAEKIEILRLDIIDILDGRFISRDFNIENQSFKIFDTLNAHLFVENEKKVSFYIDGGQWPAGLWIVNLRVKASGRWGDLINSDDEICAFGKNSLPEDIAGYFYQTFIFDNHQYLIDFFKRVNYRISLYYTIEAWKTLKWLKKIWLLLVNDYIPLINDPKMISVLLRAVTEWPEDAQKDNLLPKYFPAAEVPHIFSMDKNQYKIKGEITTAYASVFKNYKILKHLRSVFSEFDVNQAALFGFKNVSEVERNENIEPKDFNFNAYFQAINSFFEKLNLNYENWIPGKGSFLGKPHYLHSVSNLINKYRNKETDEGLKGNVLSLLKKMMKINADLYSESAFPDNVLEKNYLGIPHDLDWLFENENSETEKEHILWMISFLSLFAQICRLEAREKGILNNFMKYLKEEFDSEYMPVTKQVGYILYIGDDVFAFYLMLWELVLTADYDSLKTMEQLNV